MNSVPSVGAEECFSVTGEIIHGKHLGRTLGYPTANLPRPEGVELPPNGVHVATMTVFTGPYAGRVFPCVLNQGSQPTAPSGRATATVSSTDEKVSSSVLGSLETKVAYTSRFDT